MREDTDKEQEYELLARKLEAKADIFKGTGESAMKQEKAIRAGIKAIRANKAVISSATKASEAPTGVKSLIQAPLPTMSAEEWNNLANSL